MCILAKQKLWNTCQTSGAFAPAPNTKNPEVLIPNPQKTKRQLELLWISCGKEDNFIWVSQRMHRYLKENNVRHIFYTEPGGHDFPVWKNVSKYSLNLISKPLNKAVFDKLNKD